MITAIYFDNQHTFAKEEIHDILTDNILATAFLP